MNAKYFEENGFEDVHGSQFHKAVLNHAACIASKTVLLTVAEQQQAMDFDDETGEIYG